MIKEKEIIVPEEFNDYRNEIIKYSKQSTKKNSILYDFRVEDKLISNKIIMLQHNGVKRVLQSMLFENYGDFYEEFMHPLVDDFMKNNNVKTHDCLEEGGNSFTYRIITDTNDLLSISGIDDEEVEALNEIVDKEKVETGVPSILNLELNENGKIDPMVFVVSIVVVLVVIAGVLLFI